MYHNSKIQGVRFAYVEPLSDARTTPEDFFNSLLVGILAHSVGRRQRFGRGFGGRGAMFVKK